MNIQEFTDRTGFTPTDDYYHNVIEKAYMQSDLDKDAFCKQWKRKGGIQEAYDALRLEAANTYSNLMILETTAKEMAERASELEKAVNIKDEQIVMLQDELDKMDADKSDICRFLIWQADQYCSYDLRAKAVELMGEAAYIRYRIMNDMGLWDADKKYLAELLNQ